MFKARYLLTTLGGILGLAALAPEASARRYAECDSHVWFNSQTCDFSSAFRSRAITSSDATGTAHSIALSVEKNSAPLNHHSATVTAVDGNGVAILASSVTTTGSLQTRAFSTSASSPPRRLFTTIDSPSIIVPIAARATTQDIWPAHVTTGLLNSDGVVTGRCDTSSLSNRALTSHQIASNLTTGGVCTAFALDVNGAQFISLDDFTTDGLAERLTFTTTVAGRPRRVGAGVAPR